MYLGEIVSLFTVNSDKYPELSDEYKRLSSVWQVDLYKSRPTERDYFEEIVLHNTYWQCEMEHTLPPSLGSSPGRYWLFALLERV